MPRENPQTISKNLDLSNQFDFVFLTIFLKLFIYIEERKVIVQKASKKTPTLYSLMNKQFTENSTRKLIWIQYNTGKSYNLNGTNKDSTSLSNGCYIVLFYKWKYLQTIKSIILRKISKKKYTKIHCTYGRTEYTHNWVFKQANNFRMGFVEVRVVYMFWLKVSRLRIRLVFFSIIFFYWDWSL